MLKSFEVELAIEALDRPVIVNSKTFEDYEATLAGLHNEFRLYLEQECPSVLTPTVKQSLWEQAWELGPGDDFRKVEYGLREVEFVDQDLVILAEVIVESLKV